MSANGISRLPFKRDRQIAKLALAASNRTTSGRRATLDLTQLPTVYAENNNDTNSVIDNPNLDGLIIGRPWISLAPPLANQNLSNQSYFIFSGTQTIDAGVDFSGLELLYSLDTTVNGVSIDANTGVITVLTGAEISTVEITVRAENSSGFATSSFDLSVVIPLGLFSWDSNTESPGPAT